MNVRIQFQTQFMAGIYYDEQLQMNTYTVKLYMMTNTEDPTDQNIALNRLKYFIFNEIENTIFINEADEEACRKFISVGLNVTTLPSEPVDQLIGIMLFSKITAITEERLLIGEIEISSVLGDNIVYFHGDNENVDNVDAPEWWDTVDLVHCNTDLLNNEKVVTIHRGNDWRDVDLQWPDNDIKFVSELDETGNTVVFADFKKSDDTK